MDTDEDMPVASATSLSKAGDHEFFQTSDEVKDEVAAPRKPEKRGFYQAHLDKNLKDTEVMETTSSAKHARCFSSLTSPSSSKPARRSERLSKKQEENTTYTNQGLQIPPTSKHSRKYTSPEQKVRPRRSNPGFASCFTGDFFTTSRSSKQVLPKSHDVEPFLQQKIESEESTMDGIPTIAELRRLSKELPEVNEEENTEEEVGEEMTN